MSAGADRSLRVWQRTEEPFFVEEEREKRLESLFEADLEARSCPCCACKRQLCAAVMPHAGLQAC